jgi:hypothetical protein
VHAAGLTEAKETYVWENLSARTFESGAAANFPKKKITKALREYAIAGTLHLDHLARLRDSQANAGTLGLFAFQLRRSLGASESEIRTKLGRLLDQHACEWRNFIDSLGQDSFLRNWASEAKS